MILPAAIMAAVAGCANKSTTAVTIETAPVERRSIVLTVQANGTVEPVNIVEVKSKASGTITRMPVDIGANVKAGDLLVQIDPRDVQNQYDQAAADVSSSTVARATALAQRNRSAELYKQKIITAQEMDAANLAFANADAALIKARTNLSIAKVRLEDATVTAPTNGTVIEKPVSLGMVITSATSSASGGTTILRMADLSKVRMRAFVNETDIGNVKPGQVATVTVDAFPNRRFVGIVEQVEPSAVVQSSVTMFPVLVSLNNFDGALKPGMNGQVTMEVARHDNVVAVPSDALRSARDAMTVAPVLGLSPDSVRALVSAVRRGGGPASGRGGGAVDSTGRRRFGGAASGTPSGFGRGAGGSSGAGAFAGGAGGGGGGQSQVAFVKKGSNFEPRLVRVGISDFDYTEVLSGLNVGEQVALLGAPLLQAQREQQQQRIRAGTGGGLQQTPAGGGTGGAGARPSGGGAGGGRGGG
jgi:HlyD family secretion protein